jgi:hypothetical protein
MAKRAYYHHHMMTAHGSVPHRWLRETQIASGSEETARLAAALKKVRMVANGVAR